MQIHFSGITGDNIGTYMFRLKASVLSALWNMKEEVYAVRALSENPIQIDLVSHWPGRDRLRYKIQSLSYHVSHNPFNKW